MSKFDKTPVLWTPQRTSAVARRLYSAYEGAPAEMHTLGRQFYPLWSETAEHMGQAIGKTRDHGSAILAHLSPSTEAERNRIMGMQMIHGLPNGGHEHLVKAREHFSAAKSAEVRRRYAPGGSAEWHALTQEHEYHSNENRRHRQLAGIVGTPLGSQSSDNLGNAAAVLLGHHDDDPLGSLGGLKIGDFGRTINNPRHPRAPIDTHYHDAAMGRYDLPYDTKRGLEAAGRYESFQTASNAAHRRAQEAGHEVDHSEFMGTVWYNHQNNKVAVNEDARRSRVASDTTLARIRGNPQFAHFLPEAHGLPPSFTKISGRR